MELLIRSFPGFAFACGICFLFLSLAEYYIYLRAGYKRSRNIALFCFFSSFYAFENFVAQSRGFPVLFTHYLGCFAQMALMLSFYYYLKAMGFYVAYSERFFRFIVYCVGVIFLIFSLFIPYNLIIGSDLFFDLGNLYDSGSYFFNSYTMRAGKPFVLPMVLVNLFSLVSMVASMSLLWMVWRGSRDLVLMFGLLFSLGTVLYQYFLMPFTLRYFVPVVFISNMFEAFRMSFLSVKEFIIEVDNEGESQSSVREPDSTIANGEYQNLGLNQERMEDLVGKLRDALDRDLAYLNPSLRLEDLARKIRIPSYQLTQVIRLGFKSTFSDLINGYRIEMVKNKLINPEFKHLNIMDIASESGFNSKSTFHTVFKKTVGMTPSAYRKSVVNA